MNAPRWRQAARQVKAAAVGDAPVDRQWCRLVMNHRIAEAVAALEPARCEAVEISGSQHGGHGWRSYRRLSFPDFDLCSSAPAGVFDVVICEQVLEHVRDPWAAARTLALLCRPGGHLIVSTPFLVRVHPEPEDHWRFTGSGLRLLLEEAGLEVLSLGTWGNRDCVSANLRKWAHRRPWSSMRNEAEFPIVVWAVARRGGEGTDG